MKATQVAIIEPWPMLLKPERSHPCPPAVISERVLLTCGCTVLIGRRLDVPEPEAATFAWPCHEHTLIAFQEALLRSIQQPEDRPLAEVVARLLVEHPG